MNKDGDKFLTDGYSKILTRNRSSYKDKIYKTWTQVQDEKSRYNKEIYGKKENSFEQKLSLIKKPLIKIPSTGIVKLNLNSRNSHVIKLDLGTKT